MRAMKERGILFSAPMVRALLAGVKTQTRRVVKATRGRPVEFLGGGGRDGGDWDNPECWGYEWHDGAAFVTLKAGPEDHAYPCPYGVPGDRLWVRETFGLSYEGYAIPWTGADPKRDAEVIYRATFNEDLSEGRLPWKPSIFMPRWASRITLEITGVRVERLQDISEADAQAEGSPDYEEGVDAPPSDAESEWSYRASYRRVWQSINGPGSWDANPWVWVVEFKRLTDVTGPVVAGLVERARCTP